MEKYYIYRTGNLFKHIPSTRKDIDTSGMLFWGIIKIEYSGSLVSITFEKGDEYDNYDVFEFDEIIEGEIHHESGFGKVWNLGWKVSNGRNDWENALVLSFSGGDYTSQFAGELSIAKSVSGFLNLLFQFKDINDYIQFLKKIDKSKKQFLSQEKKDQILILAELIQLCEKYDKLNPNKPIVRTLKGKIEQQIHWIFNDIKAPE